MEEETVKKESGREELSKLLNVHYSYLAIMKIVNNNPKRKLCRESEGFEKFLCCPAHQKLHEIHSKLCSRAKEVLPTIGDELILGKQWLERANDQLHHY